MIVQCNACQAKFKIADEKVTPKGVKVRCTRCKNMFVVRRPVDTDPFPDAVTRPGVMVPDARRPTIEDEFDAPTRVGIYAAGVAATRISAPQVTEPAVPVFEPLRNGPPPPPPSADAMADPFAVPGTDDPFGGPAASPQTRDTGFQAPAPEAPVFQVTSPENQPSPDVEDAFKDLSQPEPAAAADGGREHAEHAASSSDDQFDRSAFDMGSSESTPATTTGGLIDLPPEPGGDFSPDEAATRPAPLFPTPSQRMRTGAPASSNDEPAPRPTKKAPRPKRSLAAAAANAFFLLVAAVGALISVAVYANDGIFDASALNPASLLNRLRGTPAKTGLVVSGVTNGLYETTSGRPVFYVRGTVTQFSTVAAEPVRVTVEIARPDGTQKVGHAFAGSVPSAEQIFRIAQAEDLANLEKDLAKAAPRIAKDKAVPFAAVFYDYPDDFSDARLKIHAEAQPQATTPGG